MYAIYSFQEKKIKQRQKTLKKKQRRKEKRQHQPPAAQGKQELEKQSKKP